MRSVAKLMVLIGAVGVIAAVSFSLLSLGDVDIDVPKALRRSANYCNKPSDVIVPAGSCAQPFEGEDVNAGDVKLTLIVIPDEHYIDYTFENLTSRLRSFDWRKVEMTGPNGRQLLCLGDDSIYRYEASPREPSTSGYGCRTSELESGTYVAYYDDVRVAEIDVAL